MLDLFHKKLEPKPVRFRFHLARHKRAGVFIRPFMIVAHGRDLRGGKHFVVLPRDEMMQVARIPARRLDNFQL